MQLIGIYQLDLLSIVEKSLTKNGKIIGRSVTNVDERKNDDYDKYQEYSEIVSGVSIFRVGECGANIALKNHSQWPIEVPTQDNGRNCPVCAGGSFAVYKIDDYEPCDDDDDDYGCCCQLIRLFRFSK